MAASDKGVEKRPSQASAESRAGDDVVGVDQDTQDRIVHDTTTRERTAVSKRAHEPLDLAHADDDQPAEDENGPRAKEIAPEAADATPSKNTVSEEQVKAGAALINGDADSSK